MDHLNAEDAIMTIRNNMLPWKGSMTESISSMKYTCLLVFFLVTTLFSTLVEAQGHQDPPDPPRAPDSEAHRPHGSFAL
jgi:hypothetical protein